MCLLKGLVPRNVMSKYEVNIFTNKEVMANVKVFGRNDRLTDRQTDRQTDRRTDKSKTICLPIGGIKSEPG